MRTYEAMAINEVDHYRAERVIALRLKPVQTEIRINLFGHRDRNEFEQRIDLARQLARSTMKTVTLELYRLVTLKDAPDGFDSWEAFDEDELYKTSQELKRYKEYAESLAVRLNAILDMLETIGINARPILNRHPVVSPNKSRSD